MPKILYGVSPIGLGHATRDLVVASELRRKGAEVKFFTGGKAAEFLHDRGEDVESIVDDTAPKVVDGEMRQVALWYIRSWVGLRRTTGRTERLFESYKPDLVVCDEEFSGVNIAEKTGIRRVFISDELLLGFARSWLSRKIERRVERWYRRLQDSVDLLIIPEFGSDSGNKRFVGPIVRAPTMSPTDARRKYGLPEGGMVLLSMSGSGIGRFLLRRTLPALRHELPTGTYLVVTGNRGQKLAEPGVFDLGVIEDNQNLVAAADLVVSTAGKSTIDEASSAGTPIIVIPIRNHAEQERNAAAIGYSVESMGKLPELVREKFGKREPPQDFRGGETTSRLLLSML